MSDTEKDTKTDLETPTKLRNSKNVTVAFKLNGKDYPIWSRLTKVKIGGREAYGWVKREAARRSINTAPPPTGDDDGRASDSSTGGGIGHGLAAQSQRPNSRGPPRPTTTTHRPGSRPDKSRLICSHCGKPRHSRGECFLLIGYPKWWEEKQNERAQAKLAVSVDEKGHPARIGAGNRETATGQGKSSAGASTGGDGVRRVGNFAERAEELRKTSGAVYEGKGFGLKPNPCIFPYSTFDPKKKCLLQIGPHDISFRPPDPMGYQTRPQNMENSRKSPNICSFMSNNPFAPLETISAAFHVYNNDRSSNKGWIFDCGATDTMTPDRNDFSSYGEIADTFIRTANGELITVVGSGTINISPTLCLSNCLHVPTLSQRLMSISHVTRDLNCTLLMHPTFCILQDIQTRRILGRGTEKQGLYYVDEIAQHGNAMLAHGTTKQEIWLWHRRLGHPSPGYFKLLFPNISIPTDFSCETCVLAKSHRQSFKLTNTRMNSIFSLIHADVWGPAPIVGGGSFRYFVLFVDDCTRMTWIYFLKHKSEVVEKFVLFYKMIQTQFHTTIKTLRSDNGREFVNNSMAQFCKDKGMIHQTSCAYTPEQNGVAERKNRVILEITRALNRIQGTQTFLA